MEEGKEVMAKKNYISSCGGKSVKLTGKDAMKILDKPKKKTPKKKGT